MKCVYGVAFCDHKNLDDFSFHEADAYLFDRELFRLYEEAKRRGNSHPTMLCRGRYSDGTACDSCERCRDEMRQVNDFNAQLQLRVRYREQLTRRMMPLPPQLERVYE